MICFISSLVWVYNSFPPGSSSSDSWLMYIIKVPYSKKRSFVSSARIATMSQKGVDVLTHSQYQHCTDPKISLSDSMIA